MDDRLIKLKDLESRLLVAMDGADNKTLAALARQYRETIREIEELERSTDTDDEIGDILRRRAADGEPGAVRPNRSGV